MADKKLNWKAERKGKLYCSSACGGGCTYIAYLKAKKAAANLTRQLGPGWIPKIWENLGWHYVVESTDGSMEVSHYKLNKAIYYATFNNYHTCQHNVLHKAVEGAYNMAKAEADNMAKLLLGFLNRKD